LVRGRAVANSRREASAVEECDVYVEVEVEVEVEVDVV